MNATLPAAKVFLSTGHVKGDFQFLVSTGHNAREEGHLGGTFETKYCQRALSL